MYDKSVFQPENISAAEWQLLQLLATYTDSFDVETILFRQGDETPTESDTLTFYRHFHRLKNCGYIELVSSYSEQEKSGEYPAYKLSAEGIRATLPKERPVYPMKSLATRKDRKPNSLLWKK